MTKAIVQSKWLVLCILTLVSVDTTSQWYDNIIYYGSYTLPLTVVTPQVVLRHEKPCSYDYALAGAGPLCVPPLVT